MSKGVTETDRFVFFWSGWPSQWHPAAFTVDGVRYNRCEQFMMAEKARVFGDADAVAKVLAADDPRQQKSLGRKVRGFDPVVWDGVCRGIVYHGNLARFSQDPVLAGTLLKSGEKTIVEASPLDAVWGIGLAADDPRASDPGQWPGTNWLGVALMQVREALRRGSVAAPAEPTDEELLRQLDRRRSIGRG